MSPDRQATLFDLPPPKLAVEPPAPGLQELAARLAPAVRLGTMSWSFPGWRGLVYARDAPVGALAELGLGAYAQHPLLRAVEIDRSYYDPLGADIFRAYAEQVPDDFRFVVKAHEACSVRRYSSLARHGSKRGALNPLYLDAAYATDAVVGPIQSGLGAKLGAIVFQFPPSPDALEPAAFTDELSLFLTRLPRGVPYAIELRRAEYFAPCYFQALLEGGAVHCHNAWGAMPPVFEQARQVPPAARHPLIVRWLLAPGEAYAEARERFHPFERIAREDVTTRSGIARLVAKASAHGIPALVTINNKAEGCAPESAFRLARAVFEASSGAATRAPPAPDRRP